MKRSQLRLVEAKERQREALELRKAGATYDTIARQLGYADPSGAAKAVKRAMDSIGVQEAEDLLRIELERLDHMLLVLWPMVQKGNLGAIDRALRIGERRAKLLGLEAPEESRRTIEHVVSIGGSREEYLAALKAARGEMMGEVVDAEEVEG